MIGPEDTQITVDEFWGLYDRGNVDEVPTDHAQDCLNVVFSSDSHLRTRKGLTRSLDVGYAANGIRRFFLMTQQPPNARAAVSGDPSATEGSGLLLLDNAHNLYIGNNPAVKYTHGGMSDFSALNVGNRTYVSPTTGQNGFRGGRLQVVDSSLGTFRDAAGLAPAQAAVGLTAANSATAGSVTAGVHKFAVIYETDTGFWTPPGPKIFQAFTTLASAAGGPTICTAAAHGMVTGESHEVYGFTGAWTTVNDVYHITRIDDNTFSIPIDTSDLGAVAGTGGIAGKFTPATVTGDGTKKVDLTAIPVGPAYVRRRLILATRAGEEEFFFVPNVPGCVSEINNNTATTTTVDFLDTDLVASADYLFDLLEVIPGSSGMCKYRGRFVLGGTYFPGNSERLLLSNVNDPETFNFVAGVVQIQTERDGNAVTTCYVLRDTLYASKFTGLFATEDNGGDPSSWAVTTVDAVIGSYAYGTSTFTQSQPAPDTGDIILIAARSGLYMFDGVVRRPELSWKIQSYWLRINFAAFHRVTVTHDPWNHLIYIAIPLDSATEPNKLLVCDYSAGRSHLKVKWAIWSFHKNPSCIGMMYFGTSYSTVGYTLKVGSIDASSQRLYTLTDSALTDNTTSIILSNYTLGPVSFSKGGINVFKFLNYRAFGVGNMSMVITREDGAGSVTLTALALTATPGREIQRQINFMAEKMHLKISSGSVLGDYMDVDRIDIWGLQLWLTRPTV